MNRANEVPDSPWLPVLRLAFLLPVLLATPAPAGTAEATAPSSTWPQPYTVQRDDAAGTLTLRTPYYTVSHDWRRGGAISRITLTHGRSTNLLVAPIATRLRTETGTELTDLKDGAARVSHRREGLTEIVTAESTLKDEPGRVGSVSVKTRFEYHWGYLKIRKELTVSEGSLRVREVCPFATVLTPSLSEYGYREGTTEEEGAPPFPFGSNRWGKLRHQKPTDPPLETRFVPRSLLFADPGVEGIEWFVGSDLTQWDLQCTGRRGQGRCVLELSKDPPGLALAVAPFSSGDAAVGLPSRLVFDFYLGLPLLEGHALKPWLHNSFNRNRGDWVSAEQIQRWKESGIQTVHCHHDGDYYEDGLFWRDGSYPPYPDMDRYDQVIRACHTNGIRVATYFSNKELHPSTKAFQEHGAAWGRKDRKGNLQHNFFRPQSEFGVQMCLRSGWLDCLKSSIDRVLKNHPLDGVYYDWNVALFCCNPLHEGKEPPATASGHWDIDELLDLMEWTRQRVGPRGLVIVHNTTTPMFTLENFADSVVANEWGYGKWAAEGPQLSDLPLEWTLVGARARGVISYGQLDAQSPKRLHRLFAIEALLGGVTPWPASPETFELFAPLQRLEDIGACRFADWRNPAVVLSPSSGCASAVYSRPGQAYVLLANTHAAPQDVQCVVFPERLPYPLTSLASARLAAGPRRTADAGDANDTRVLDARQLTRDGVSLAIPADTVLWLELRE